MKSKKSCIWRLNEISWHGVFLNGAVRPRYKTFSTLSLSIIGRTGHNICFYIISILILIRAMGMLTCTIYTSILHKHFYFWNLRNSHMSCCGAYNGVATTTPPVVCVVSGKLHWKSLFVQITMLQFYRVVQLWYVGWIALEWSHT